MATASTAVRGIARISNRISLTTLPDALTILQAPPSQTSFVLINDAVPSDTPSSQHPPSPTLDEVNASSQPNLATYPPLSSSPSLEFIVPGGKKSQTFFLHTVLPTSLEYIGVKLECGENVVVACPSAKDLSVGVVLGALGRFFNDDGKYVRDNRPSSECHSNLRDRQWG